MLANTRHPTHRPRLCRRATLIMVGMAQRHTVPGFGAVDTRLHSTRLQIIIHVKTASGTCLAGIARAKRAHNILCKIAQCTWHVLRHHECRWLTLYARRWLAGLAVQPQPELRLTHPCQCGSFEFISTFPAAIPTKCSRIKKHYVCANLLCARISAIFKLTKWAW